VIFFTDIVPFFTIAVKKNIIRDYPTKEQSLKLIKLNKDFNCDFLKKGSLL